MLDKDEFFEKNLDIKEAKGNKSALDELLWALPEEAQYSVYHDMISAAGHSSLIRPMTTVELEHGAEIATLLHKKFNYGHST